MTITTIHPNRSSSTSIAQVSDVAHASAAARRIELASVGSRPRRCATIVRAIATAVMLLSCGPSGHAQVIADSITDYSGVQGQSGWYFGFYNGPYSPAGFQQFPVFGTYGSTTYNNVWSRTASWPGGFWTNVGPDDLGHPNGYNGNGGTIAELNYSVRRWVSSYAGPATVSARLRKQNTNGGNGVMGHLWVNGVEIWSTYVNWWDTVGVTVSEPLCLAIGDVIDFALDPVSGDDAADGSYFGFTVNGPIVTQPTPASTCPSHTVEFSITTLPGGTFTYQWRRNSQPISTITNPSAATASLTLTNVRFADAGLYDCVVTNACGSATSTAAALTVLACCPADIDGNQSVNVADLLAVITNWGSCPSPCPPRCAADIAPASGDCNVNVSDLLAVITAWGACP